MAELSNFVNGLSSVIHGDILINATWSQGQCLRHPTVYPCWCKSNPVVELSRRHVARPRTVDLLAFPMSLLQALRSEFGRREGSCANTLLSLLTREGESSPDTATGSARWFLFPTITWEPPLLTWVVLVSARILRSFCEFGDRIDNVQHLLSTPERQCI